MLISLGDIKQTNKIQAPESLGVLANTVMNFVSGTADSVRLGVAHELAFLASAQVMLILLENLILRTTAVEQSGA